MGNIGSGPKAARSRPVHPHVCGEHVAARLGASKMGGSSPRVWGTYPPSVFKNCSVRFIPTCVGNICASSTQQMSIPVHPHVCGEHLMPVISTSIDHGSSPRVWGTCSWDSYGKLEARFIPTCVGNIIPFVAGDKMPTVHPHVCGEHL